MESTTPNKETVTTIITKISPEEKEKIIELFSHIMRRSKEETAISFLKLISLITEKSCIETHEIIGG